MDFEIHQPFSGSVSIDIIRSVDLYSSINSKSVKDLLHEKNVLYRQYQNPSNCTRCLASPGHHLCGWAGPLVLYRTEPKPDHQFGFDALHRNESILLHGDVLFDLSFLFGEVHAA